MFTLADPIEIGLGIWGLAGLVVALGFVLFGFDRVDAGAPGSYAVRPLLLPGLVLLWPLVLWRWMALVRQRGE